MVKEPKAVSASDEDETTCFSIIHKCFRCNKRNKVVSVVDESSQHQATDSSNELVTGSSSSEAPASALEKKSKKKTGRRSK